jgi:hypothetical protein
MGMSGMDEGYLPGRTAPSCRGNMLRAALLGLLLPLWFALALLGVFPGRPEEPGVCRLCGNFGSGDESRPCPDCKRTGV